MCHSGSNLRNPGLPARHRVKVLFVLLVPDAGINLGPLAEDIVIADRGAEACQIVRFACLREFFAVTAGGISCHHFNFVFSEGNDRAESHRGPAEAAVICRSIREFSRPETGKIIRSGDILQTAEKPESPKVVASRKPIDLFILPFSKAGNGSVSDAFRRDDSVQGSPTIGRGGTEVSLIPALMRSFIAWEKEYWRYPVNPAADGDS